MAAAATVAVAGLLLTGCANKPSGDAGEGGAGQPAATPGPSNPAAAPGRPVPDALQFRAAGLDGTAVNGADFAGKDVALWFWAPW